MLRMLKQWETSLFRDDGVVPVKFKRNGELQPLNLLIVRQVKSKRPVIVRVGSVLDDRLRMSSRDPNVEANWKEFAEELEQDLVGCREGFLEGPLKTLQMSGRHDFEDSFKASVGIMGSLATILFGSANHSGSLFCKLLDNQTVAIKTGVINRLFDPENPLWEPKMAQFNSYKHVQEDNGDFELWVVTEILTSSMLIIAKSKEDAIELGVDASLIVPGDVSGLLGKAKLNCFKRENRYFRSEAPDGEPSFTYGFRALRLQYNEHGNLESKDVHMGNVQPEFRGSNTLSTSLEDPVYNMGAFFSTSTFKEDSKLPDNLECLEWEDEDNLIFTEVRDNLDT